MNMHHMDALLTPSSLMKQRFAKLVKIIKQRSHEGILEQSSPLQENYLCMANNWGLGYFIFVKVAQII